MKLKKPPALYVPSRDELAEFDTLEGDDIEAVEELNSAAAGAVATASAYARHDFEAALDGELIDWDGGIEIVLAALEAADPYWRWSKERIVGYWNGDGDRPVYDWEKQWPPIRQLTPEQIAAQEQELLALERELDGPFHYVDRNRDPSKPSVGSQWLSMNGKANANRAKPMGSRKSRKKPVFWSPKKAD
ncbi:hypothetical protein [Bradyrhizobium cosmicum]|uniref:hypothetical protein n=1 Tax=Bradyrhizobium cosmicum TaxID=1404864 RepID=UPI0028EE3346|nr:hypothetical protein [Bradyrhizobium cosmicum]